MSRTIQGRISEWGLSAEGQIALKVYDEDFALYASRAAGQAVSRPVEDVPLPGSTRLVLMDIPILRDQDNFSGYYAAVHGLGTGWTGSVVFVSLDGGATYTRLVNFTKNTVMGTAATALASGITTMWDHVNTVDLTLVAGDALFSDTKLNCLNGANAALLGKEVLVFQNATQLDPTTWRISDLIRGVAGTEWAVGTHAAGEIFCLLSPTTNLRIRDSLSDLNVVRPYIAPSVGQTMEDAAIVNFADTGVDLKPWSPNRIRGDGASDRTISWQRRSRIRGSNGRDFFDPPLGETSEDYEVEILSDDELTIHRTFTSLTSPSVVYTAAQQTSDFGAPKPANSIHTRVYQISAAVGRGYPGSGIV